MKTVRQEYTPVPKNTIRIIICEGDAIGVKRTTIQTTTVGEFKMIKALSMYQGTPEGRKKRKPRQRLQHAQVSQEHTPA